MDYFNFISEKAKLNPNADDPDKLGAGLYSRNLEKDQVTFIPKSQKQCAIYSKSPISLTSFFFKRVEKVVDWNRYLGSGAIALLPARLSNW